MTLFAISAYDSSILSYWWRVSSGPTRALNEPEPEPVDMHPQPDRLLSEREKDQRLRCQTEYLYNSRLQDFNSGQKLNLMFFPESFF